MTEKSLLSRRDFCATTAGIFLAGLMKPGFLPAANKKTKSSAFDVAAIERGRVLSAADRYLKESPITITSYTSPRSAGGKHDYFSEGDYWWPDPKNPDGPYIQRDGMSNPDNFTAHRHAMIRLSEIVGTLASAYALTSDDKYVRQAVKHLKAWFVEPET